MNLYADSAYPVEDWLAELHADELRSFAETGTWWRAAERTEIAAESRRARSEAGLQAADANPPPATALPEPARRVAREAALGGVRIDSNFCRQAQADGLSEEAYVETIGITARLAHLDVFTRGLDLPPHTLLPPADDAAPPRTRPAEATDEGFYTASVPSAPAGGDIALQMYGKHQAANILRSLSLVPDEARRLNRFMDQAYCSMEQIFDMQYSPHPALSRPQVEFIAARVSALNQCFY